MVGKWMRKVNGQGMIRGGAGAERFGPYVQNHIHGKGVAVEWMEEEDEGGIVAYDVKMHQQLWGV